MEGDRFLIVVMLYDIFLVLLGFLKRKEIFILKIRLKFYDYEVKLKLNCDKMLFSYIMFVVCKLVKDF